MDMCSPNFRKFLRLRSYVHQMKAGGRLLIRSANGLRPLRFFLDSSLSQLSWAEMNDQYRWASIQLTDIEDIVYEQGGSHIPSPADPPSFLIITKHRKEIDIVAPNWRDFEVWYQGLVFLTEIGSAYSHRLLDVLRSTQQHTEDSASESNCSVPKGIHAAQPKSQSNPATRTIPERSYRTPPAGITLSSENEESSVQDSVPDTSSMNSYVGLTSRLDALERMVIEQQKIIGNLQEQNEILQDIRLQKDQTIQRLLRDLQESTPDIRRRMAPAYYSSRESDFNHQSRRVLHTE